MIEAINTWQMQSFATFLQKLKAVVEPDGTLLDNSLILLGAGLDGTGYSSSGNNLATGSSNVHRHTRLPILLAGSGGGAVRSGRHIVYNNAEPIADLYISMAAAAGVNISTFGLEGTGQLGQLT